MLGILVSNIISFGLILLPSKLDKYQTTDLNTFNNKRSYPLSYYSGEQLSTKESVRRLRWIKERGTIIYICGQQIIAPTPLLFIGNNKKYEMQFYYQNQISQMKSKTITESTVSQVASSRIFLAPITETPALEIKIPILDIETVDLCVGDLDIMSETSYIKVRPISDVPFITSTTGGDSSEIAKQVALAVVSAWVSYLMLAGLIEGAQGFGHNHFPKTFDPPSYGGSFSSKTNLNHHHKSAGPRSLQVSGLSMNDQDNNMPTNEKNYAMSYEKALTLSKEIYHGEMTVTGHCKITDFKAASHLYHSPGLGINPEDYGVTMDDLQKLRDSNGMVDYLRQGNKPFPIKFVKAYQQAIKDQCLAPEGKQVDNARHYDINGIKPIIGFQNDRFIAIYDQKTGEFITGNEWRPNTVKKFEENQIFGADKWIKKWSNTK